VAHLALGLLGPFWATLDGRSAEGLSSDRLCALLAYLAVDSGREHTREEVAALLWPERPDREALSALRYALSNLHAALGERGAPSPFLLVTRTTVQFNPASDHWLDVAEFRKLKGRFDVAALERAVSLYRGPFLHGLSVRDSPAFDEWMLLQGEEYRREVLLVLGRLTSLQMARGEHGEAARWARRQLELEPYREQAHRQLMAALALGGERSAALAHYETCRRLLAEELGCQPEDETQGLYAQIRDGALLQPTGRRGDAERSRLRVSASPLLPLSASRFVAREQELDRLNTLLEQALAGQGGVALVSGEAGSGKTALLDEFARRAGAAYGDLITLRGRCNAHGGAGDPCLPFREILQTLAGDVAGKRAGGTLSQEQARRVREALPAVGTALVEHGPDLIDTFVPGEALLRRAEELPAVGSAGGRPGGRRASSEPGWPARLGEMLRRAEEGVPAMPQPDLFGQVTQVLHTVSLEQPLLLAVDDLQWADSGTQALLFHLGRRLAGSRILLACAFRPEALHAWVGDGAESSGMGTVLHELRREWGDVLIDLDQADGRRFVEAYVDSEPNRLSAAFRQALYERTGGNALFTVELLRSFEREGTLRRDEAGLWVEGQGLDWERWPPQVEAVIAAHLAALPDQDRALLQAASVQGEQFAAEVAARALGWAEETAIQRLSGPLRTRHGLVEAVSLDQLASSGRPHSTSSGQRLSRYRFRHWLLQQGAYRGLDLVARARLHEETGRALEAIYEAAGVEAPALARHYEAAGLPLAAARHRLEAGRWAVRLAAYDEAIRHLERGLTLLEGVAPSRERLRLELGLWVAMATPVMMQRGLQALAYTLALEHLSELVQHPDLQDDPQRPVALAVLALSAGWSADPVRTRQVGQQLLDLAPSAGSEQAPTEASGQPQDGSQQTLLLGHWALGFSHWLRGQPVPAREHLSRALALYDPDANHPRGGSLVGDPGVMAQAMLGGVQWQLGYPDQARACFRQAVAQAQALEQPSSAAFAHYIAAMVTSLVGRDADAALRHAEALRPLGEVSLVYRAWAEMLAGQAQAQCGQADRGATEPGPEQGLARVVEAASGWRAGGSGGGYAALLLLQAEVCARAGQVEMGLRAVDQAQAWIERTGVRATHADVWRMRGELMLLEASGAKRPPPRAEAEACFQRALDIAREQQARLFELRAAVSLARLWQVQDRRAEARELLAGIYGWFTEGFDTPDLVEAEALLAELR
jgi:DNA-binding SARP family transcriptional activator/tetratricopeptide (TPR) repeat protein